MGPVFGHLLTVCVGDVTLRFKGPSPPSATTFVLGKRGTIAFTRRGVERRGVSDVRGG